MKGVRHDQIMGYKNLGGKYAFKIMKGETIKSRAIKKTFKNISYIGDYSKIKGLSQK